jgi:hypothetical protein
MLPVEVNCHTIKTEAAVVGVGYHLFCEVNEQDRWIDWFVSEGNDLASLAAVRRLPSRSVCFAMSIRNPHHLKA